VNYNDIADKIIKVEGVEKSTMMNTPCLRYKGEFIAMMFDKEAALIVKVPAERVKEIIAEGKGREFKFTKTRFKEWVLIPTENEATFGLYIHEALEYAKEKLSK
jgi:hypothetical protein